MKRQGFGRRELLAAAGFSLFVPAFLKSAFAGAETSGPRLLLFMQACGTHQATFWPDAATGTSPILQPILSRPELAARAIVLRGLENRTAPTLGNGHDQGFAGLWSGVDLIGTPEDPFGGGESIDQQLKRALTPGVLFPTMNLGVLAADVGPKCNHRRSFAYLGPGQQIPTQVDPYRVYAALFPSDGAGDPLPPVERLRVRRSVLDYAARDLADLSKRVGPSERRKLDAHTTALREYEQRLIASQREGAGVCQKPAAPGAGLDPTAEANFPVLADLMLDLTALALSCNLTRIVTFQLGLAGNQMRYHWLGLDRDSHEEVAHRDLVDSTDAVVADAMTKISIWTAERVARLAGSLASIPEANGTALDSSLVIWANENSTGYHSMTDIPVVLLGRANGQLTRTGLVNEGPQTHYQLGTTVLNLMGVPATGFGLQPTCGPLRGLV